MKRELNQLSRRYALILQKHVKQGPQASLQPARSLGHQAVAIGLETLDLARVHEEALAALELSDSRDGILKRAEMFFTEAITPIEKTHRTALKGSLQLSRLNRTLARRTADLAATNQSLIQGIARRKAVEKALQKSGAHSEKLLKESHQLQKHLQRMTHKIMSAQEDKRKKFSHDLQDEIAQTLVAINVRLLTLKKEADLNTDRLKKDIASTQRLVDKSVKSIKRFAREFGKHHED